MAPSSRPEFQIINPVTYEGWDEIIASLPQVCFFHASPWARVLSETYHYEPIYFVAFVGGRLVGLLPLMEVNSVLTGRRGVSLPFTDFCEPIAEGNVELRDIFEQVLAYGRDKGWKYVELRGGKHLLEDANMSDVFWAHTLPLLSDEKKVAERFRDSTKRNIKKAISSNVVIRELSTIEAVREFYELNCQTRRDHGLPPQPWRFFEAIHRHVISPGYGVVVLGYYQDRVISGNIYFHFADRAIYKYGASDRRFLHLRASNLVMWEGIKKYCREDYKELHFGRTEQAHQGLRQFKMGWGPEEKTMEYVRYSFDTGSFLEAEKPIGRFYHTVFRNTPICMLKAVGSVMYRHMA